MLGVCLRGCEESDWRRLANYGLRSGSDDFSPDDNDELIDEDSQEGQDHEERKDDVALVVVVRSRAYSPELGVGKEVDALNYRVHLFNY